LRSGKGEFIGQIRDSEHSKCPDCDRVIQDFSDPPLQGPDNLAGVSEATTVTVGSRERRTMAALLLAAALLILAYWVAWYAHRSLVAAETTVPYTQFEGAFPLADGWLALCLLAASFCLLTARRAALFWLLAGGGAGIYLFCMDVLYDLEHGVYLDLMEAEVPESRALQDAAAEARPELR
jgi:hypothetical protein